MKPWIIQYNKKVGISNWSMGFMAMNEFVQISEPARLPRPNHEKEVWK